MIARVWHGYTKPEHADAYENMLKPELLPGISKVKGYKGSYLLRRNLGVEVEFITILLWESIDAIRDHAANPTLSLSWFDATVLTRRAREQVHALRAAPAMPPCR